MRFKEAGIGLGLLLVAACGGEAAAPRAEAPACTLPGDLCAAVRNVGKAALLLGWTLDDGAIVALEREGPLEMRLAFLDPEGGAGQRFPGLKNPRGIRLTSDRRSVLFTHDQDFEDLLEREAGPLAIWRDGTMRELVPDAFSGQYELCGDGRHLWTLRQSFGGAAVNCGEVQVLDLDAPEREATAGVACLNGSHPPPPPAAAFAGDCRSLLFHDTDRLRLHRYDLTSNTNDEGIEGGIMWSVSLDPLGRSAILRGFDGPALFATGVPLAAREIAPEAAAYDALFSDDGRYVVVFSSKAMLLFDTTIGALHALGSVAVSPGEGGAAFSPDGRFLAHLYEAGGPDTHELIVTELGSRTPVLRLAGARAYPESFDRESRPPATFLGDHVLWYRSAGERTELVATSLQGAGELVLGEVAGLPDVQVHRGRGLVAWRGWSNDLRNYEHDVRLGQISTGEVWRLAIKNTSVNRAPPVFGDDHLAFVGADEEAYVLPLDAVPAAP